MKHRPPRLNLIERALIERDWHQTAVSAQIHALYGDNSHHMVDAAGRVLYVILGAAAKEGVDPMHDDVLTVRRAVQAMHEQVGEVEIDTDHRVCIVCGLEAAERLMFVLQRGSLIEAACNLQAKLRQKHLLLSDFEALI